MADGTIFPEGDVQMADETEIWRPAHNEVVYVAELKPYNPGVDKEIVCVPGFKTVAWAGKKRVGFTDGDDLPLSLVYPITSEGHEACLLQCQERIRNHSGHLGISARNWDKPYGWQDGLSG